MQRTGSFKIRGAFNKLSSLTEAERCKGVVACSAGNHAQGVSLSCAMLGIDGKVVMPKGAPKSKVAATCDYSAEVVLHGDNFNDTIAKVSEIVETEGRIFIPPYDDPKVIAGQGTIGLEILEDLYDVDNVIVPIGGGGLIAGIAVAIKSINPTIKIIGVQSENVHGMAASFHAGEITTHRTTGTLADGCASRCGCGSSTGFPCPSWRPGPRWWRAPGSSSPYCRGRKCPGSPLTGKPSTRQKSACGASPSTARAMAR